MLQPLLGDVITPKTNLYRKGDNTQFATQGKGYWIEQIIDDGEGDDPMYIFTNDNGVRHAIDENCLAKNFDITK